MTEVKLSEFQSRFSELLDSVISDGRCVKITDEGKLVAQLIPNIARPETLMGHLPGSVVIRGDIVSPSLASGRSK